MSLVIAYIIFFLFYQLGYVYLYYDWQWMFFLLLLIGILLLEILKIEINKKEIITFLIAIALSVSTFFVMPHTTSQLFLYFVVMYFISLESFVYTRNMQRNRNIH